MWVTPGADYVWISPITEANISLLLMTLVWPDLQSGDHCFDKTPFTNWTWYFLSGICQGRFSQTMTSLSVVGKSSSFLDEWGVHLWLRNGNGIANSFPWECEKDCSQKGMYCDGSNVLLQYDAKGWCFKCNCTRHCYLHIPGPKGDGTTTTSIHEKVEGTLTIQCWRSHLGEASH